MTLKRVTLSARTIGTLLGKNPWQTPWQCFVEKVTGKSAFSTNAAMQHGLRYEKQAVDVYKVQTQHEVETPKETFVHPSYSFITGKIDGLITKKDGKKAILEVKCPYTKKFPDSNDKDWEVKEFYWIQVQIYMEILNIGETHFVEYYFDNNRSLFRSQVIFRDQHWWHINQPKIERWYKEIVFYKDMGLEMHPVYEVIKQWERKDCSLEEQFEEKL